MPNPNYYAKKNVKLLLKAILEIKIRFSFIRIYSLRYHNIIYKTKKLSLFQKILILLFMVRSLAAFINCFLPFDMPHVVRQTDTLSIAMRYWSRWIYEQTGENYFIPAVLNSDVCLLNFHL